MIQRLKEWYAWLNAQHGFWTVFCLVGIIFNVWVEPHPFMSAMSGLVFAASYDRWAYDMKLKVK
jgi:hypothetical protein